MQYRGVHINYNLLYIYRAEIGEYMHPCEGELVCRNTNEKIPYFNAPVYLENKSQIGKVDDIFGPIKDNVSYTAIKEFLQLSVCCLKCVLDPLPVFLSQTHAKHGGILVQQSTEGIYFTD